MAVGMLSKMLYSSVNTKSSPRKMCIRDRDIRRVNTAALREQESLVTQETELFDEDVYKRQIENRGKNFTCCGCWKSYGDPDAAQKHFDQLSKCTAVYLRLFHSGTPILRLAVAA